MCFVLGGQFGQEPITVSSCAHVWAAHFGSVGGVMNVSCLVVVVGIEIVVLVVLLHSILSQLFVWCRVYEAGGPAQVHLSHCECSLHTILVRHGVVGCQAARTSTFKSSRRRACQACADSCIRIISSAAAVLSICILHPTRLLRLTAHE